MNPADDLVRAVEAVVFASSEPMTEDAIRGQLNNASGVAAALKTLQIH